MLDQTDLEILKFLSKNSRMQWQEIGDKVHMSGQAVKNRVDRLEKLGIIEGYTININKAKLGKTITGYVTVFMKTTDHQSFIMFLREEECISEASRVSGEGCYILKVTTASQDELISILDKILGYGSYKISIDIDRIK